MPSTSSFRFQSVNGFFTYSQANDLSAQQIYDWYFEKFPNLLTLRVGQEDHADNTGIHFHVYVHFGERFRTRDQRYFDIAGTHPNIVSRIASPFKTWEYCGKDGTTLDFGPAPRGGKTNPWSRVIEASTKAEALIAAREASPRDYVLSYDKILSFCEFHFASVPEPYITPIGDPFNVPQPLIDWWDQAQDILEVRT